MKHPTLILPYLLFAVFLHLKLGGDIDWSWWIVFAPIWGWFVITFVGGFVFAFVIAYRNAQAERHQGGADGEGRAKSRPVDN